MAEETASTRLLLPMAGVINLAKALQQGETTRLRSPKPVSSRTSGRCWTSSRKVCSPSLSLPCL